MRSPMRSLARAAVVGLSAAVLVSPAAALATPTAHHAAKKKHHKKKHHKKKHHASRRGPRGPRGLPGANGINGTNGANGANGAQGPAGTAGALHYRTVIAAAQTGTGTRQPQGTPTTLLTFGPFALVGYCYRTTDTSSTPPTVMTNSDTYVVTSQNGSSADSITAAAARAISARALAASRPPTKSPPPTRPLSSTAPAGHMRCPRPTASTPTTANRPTACACGGRGPRRPGPTARSTAT